MEGGKRTGNTGAPAANAAGRKKETPPVARGAGGGKKGHQQGRSDIGYSAHSR